jgi:hypothetical protein
MLVKMWQMTSYMHGGHRDTYQVRLALPYISYRLIIIIYRIILPYSQVMTHMGHETRAGAYPSGGEHSARMLMTPIPLESLFN